MSTVAPELMLPDYETASPQAILDFFQADGNYTLTADGLTNTGRKHIDVTAGL